MRSIGYLIIMFLTALYTSCWWMAIICEPKSPAKAIGIVVCVFGSLGIIGGLYIFALINWEDFWK